MPTKPPAPPKLSKIVRKLKLSKEIVASDPGIVPAVSCTKRATGCPIHTC